MEYPEYTPPPLDQQSKDAETPPFEQAGEKVGETKKPLARIKNWLDRIIKK